MDEIEIKLFVCLYVKVEIKCEVKVHSIQILNCAMVKNMVQKRYLSCRTVVQCNLITEKQIPSVTNAFSGLLETRLKTRSFCEYFTCQLPVVGPP